MFKIICVGGKNCVHVVNKCLNSIVEQVITDWEMALVLEPADYKIYVEDERIKKHINSERLLGMANTVKALSMLDIDDEDIIVFMDADDWLLDNYSLTKVRGVYEKYPDTLITHGSWKSFPPLRKGDRCGPNNAYTEKEFKNLRGSRWSSSALRTMKYKLFKLIKDEDLRNNKGEYFAGAERAIMYPAMEMAGYSRVKFIKEVICVYNTGRAKSSYDNIERLIKEYKQLESRLPYNRLPKDF